MVYNIGMVEHLIYIVRELGIGYLHGCQWKILCGMMVSLMVELEAIFSVLPLIIIMVMIVVVPDISFVRLNTLDVQ